MADAELQNKDLLDALKEQGKLQDEQIAALRQEKEANGTRFEDQLVSQQLANPEEIAEAKATLYGLPYVDVTSYTVAQEALNVIPSRIAKTYNFAAFEVENGKIKLGVLDPIDLKAEEALQLIANRNGLEFIFYIISQRGFEHLYNQYSDIESEVKEALEDTDEEQDLTEKEAKRKAANDALEADVRNAPISKIVATILKDAVRKKASDIHIEPVGREIRVRMRLDGELDQVLTLPVRVLPSVVSRVKVLSNLKIDETRLPQDGRFSMSVDKKPIDFRVSVLPVTAGEVKNAEKVVMRVLDKSKGLFDLEELGLWGKQKDDVLDALAKPYGMFLMTGPTGSGKTTTLYGALEILNKESVNVSTLEDPVEYYIDGVNQSQINPDIGFTFASGLRSILRQDPDGIMVGEIRDQETAEMAIHASLTGHIVLSTLHTNTAAGAVPRLIDMGIEPFLIASATNTVAAQRLVRKIDENVKEEVTLTDEMKRRINAELEKIPEDYLNDLDIKDIKLYQGREDNGKTDGYQGRMAVYEVIPVTPAMRDLIPEKPGSDEVEELARKEGSISIFQDGLLKALKGLTTFDEVMRISNADSIINNEEDNHV